MATLTGTQIANTYKQLLQVGSGNNGLTASVQNVQDGQGNNSPLQLSQSAVNIDGTFQLNGVTLTANASALNDIADLTGATGIIAVSGGNVYGRTLTGGTGVSITNADGTEGNPTIALNPTGVVSASYGPATNIEINSVGQVVSAGAVTSVSVSGVTANTFTGGTFAGTTGDFSSNVSVGGNLVIAGQFSPASLSVTGTINATKISATDATFNNNVSVGGNLVIAGQFSPAALSVTGTVNAANISATNATFNNNVSVGGNLVVTGQLSPAALSVTGTVNATKISATNATFNSVVSAGFFVGDGSGLINVPSVEGGTVKAITAGTGIKLTVDAAVTTTIPVSGTVAVSANQNFGSVSVSTALAVTGSALFGIVSATNIDTDELLIAGVSAATVTEVAAVSALTQINLDSITSINGIIEGNVSADSGTFNTLTVVTSASVGGTLNVGGNVGIGTASPTSKAVILTTTAAPTSAIWTAENLTLTDDTAYAAGVGGALTFEGKFNTAGAYSTFGYIRGSKTNASDGGFQGGIVYGTRNGNHVFVTNGGGLTDGTDERMRITNGGNVGIGTTSPSSTLEIVDSVTNPIQIKFDSTASSASGRLGVGSTGNGIAVFDDNTVLESRTGGLALGIDNNNPILFFNTSARTERMRIDSAGNMLLGTSSATTDLAYAPKLKLSGSGPVLYLEETDASQDYSVTALGGKFYIRDATAVVPRLTIDSSGNVGIGTASPSSLLNIYINSLSDREALVLNSNGGVLNGASIDIQRSNVSMGKIDADYFEGMRFYVTDGAGAAATERMRIDAGGNVGIGTSSPSTPLTVAGKGTFSGAGSFEALELITSDTNRVYVTGNSSVSGDMWRLGTSASNPNLNIDALRSNGEILFRTGGTNERMRIDSSGNVGIGTTAPDGKLNVQRTAASAGWIINGQTAGVANDSGLFVDASNNIELAVRNGSGTLTGAVRSSGVTFFNGGDVGIGTSSPDRLFEVEEASGDAWMRLRASDTGGGADTIFENLVADNSQNNYIYFGDLDDTNIGMIRYSHASNFMSFTTNTAERLRITSTGNVGIGTTNPTGKLTVSSDIKVLGSNFANIEFTGASVNGSGVYTGLDSAGGYVVNVRDAGYIAFSTTNTERMRIDSSGNVGIGVATIDTALGTKLHVAGTIRTDTGAAASNPAIVFDHDNFADADANYIMLDRTSEAMRFNVNASERMRIDSSGTLLVGMTASSDTLANTGIELYNNGRLNATRTGNPVLYLNRKTSGGTIVTFRLDGGEEGTISIDSSSGVSYNTTSDYRLKENITEVTGAANRVKALNPVRFNFIAAPDKIVDGFLAHEVSNIVPEAIHGEKDAIDAEGNPKYQGIDQSKLVPLLTAALQEALTKIDELEARVAALETA